MPKMKNDSYVECQKCGDKIPKNTHKKLVYCKCETIAVDGCEYYTRIIGNEGTYKIV